MKLERIHITVFVCIAAIIWLIVLLCQGTVVTWDHGRPFSIVVTCLVILGLFFEYVFWHQSWLHGWFVNRPDLRGTWLVELQSSYIDPQTDERVPQITCYIGVKQTLSKLNMHLMTSESESRIIADHIRPSPNGNGFQVICVYTNEPNIHLRNERISEMHQGAFILETHGPSLRPTSLSAKYWTDRKTTGTMNFRDRVNDVYTRFDEADRAFRSRHD